MSVQGPGFAEVGFHVGDTQVLYELSVIHFLYPNVHLSYQGEGGEGKERRGAVFLCVQQETPLSMALYISFSLVNVKNNNILNRKYY